jgi:hypothetical protein
MPKISWDKLVAEGNPFAGEKLKSPVGFLLAAWQRGTSGETA